jgi:hypothetical protein
MDYCLSHRSDSRQAHLSFYRAISARENLANPKVSELKNRLQPFGNQFDTLSPPSYPPAMDKAETWICFLPLTLSH